MPEPTFFRRYDADRDPEELLDPANQHSTPWGDANTGRCDKCGGSGTTQYLCFSCVEGEPTPDCLACGGRVRYRDVCPACEGDGVIENVERRGVSVFPTLGGLYRYLVDRDAGFENAVLIELEGRLSGERDLDADDGALLVIPTRIVARHDVDAAYVEQLRARLAAENGGDPP